MSLTSAKSVWQLRGWAYDRPVPLLQNCMQFNAGEDGRTSVVILSRSDGRPAADWRDIRMIRDGRERLGYNPAMETREISREDWDSVRSRVEFRPDDPGTEARLRVKGGDKAALARL